MKTKTIAIILLIVMNIGLDQYSKFVVREHVVPGSRTEIMGKLIQLMNVENSGAFLGIGSDSNPTIKLIFLLILPTLVLGVVLFYLFSNKDLDQWSIIGFSSIVGGGIANLFDRLVYGSVTDFIFMDFGFAKTGIFNAADLSVTTGMVLLLIASFKHRKDSSKA